MRIRVIDSELYLTNCSTRLPFRFGSATMTRAPLGTVRVRVETGDGRRAQGCAADLLVPKWFEKDPTKTLGQDVENLIESYRLAAEVYRRDDGHLSVFDQWWRAYGERVGASGADEPDLLVKGFGVALIERALIDAACRAADVSFFDALKRNLFGFEPARVHAELAGWDCAAALPSEPLDSVNVRHTIGLLDPLEPKDVEPARRAGDGFPESLADDVRTYGLTHFKIKLSGDPGLDLDRLSRIARVIDRSAPDSPRITLDGNEQFDSIGAVARLLERVSRDSSCRCLLDGLLLIEQPLGRSATFDEGANSAMGELDDFAPLIIDEADMRVDSFKRAIDLGYRGVSVKNCKGVFRALLNHGLCRRLGNGLFQSAEDLTNLPIIALQQDLATVAALGLSHVERNGHHYFAGLDHLPAREVADALSEHADLYHATGSRAALDIREGRLSLRSLQTPGYAYAVTPDFEARAPAERWSWSEG